MLWGHENIKGLKDITIKDLSHPTAEMETSLMIIKPSSEAPMVLNQNKLTVIQTHSIIQITF